MDRINQICRHPLWRESVEKIRELERERIFCGHDIAHFLDVARIAYIENLEKNLGIYRELIYAAALLHDIGRHLQYLEKIPHQQGSATVAESILKDCGFTQDERQEILSAIVRHRIRETSSREDLAGVLYRADKASRACWLCEAREACNWSPEKKNLMLKR